MQKLSREEISSSFIKKPKDLFIPDLDTVAWDDLSYFGWFHRSGHKAYIASNYQGKLLGIELDVEAGSKGVKYKMCSICHTLHIGSNISLFTYSIIRPRYRTFGEYICSNLNCSLYVKEVLKSEAVQMAEDISIEDKLNRLAVNLEHFNENYIERIVNKNFD